MSRQDDVPLKAGMLRVSLYCGSFMENVPRTRGDKSVAVWRKQSWLTDIAHHASMKKPRTRANRFAAGRPISEHGRCRTVSNKEVKKMRILIA